MQGTEKKGENGAIQAMATKSVQYKENMRMQQSKGCNNQQEVSIQLETWLEHQQQKKPQKKNTWTETPWKYMKDKGQVWQDHKGFLQQSQMTHKIK